MKNPRLLIIAFVFLTTTGSKAQTVPALLKSMLDNTLDSMQLYVNNKSMNASIQLSNTAVWSRAAGISSLTPYADATTTDAYEIGSVAKTMTAGCVLHLADQGMLDLNDSLHNWIDTIIYINPDITIRQLLRHQTGLYDVLNNPAHQPALLADQDSIWSAKDFITDFIQPAPGVAGGSFNYCNTNYFLLGMVIESVTGNPFEDEIRSRFLTPLNLTTLAIPSLETFTSPVAHVWMDTNGDAVTEDAHSFFFNWMSLNAAVAAAGGYYGTASDVSQWMRSYMRGDLLSPGMMTDAQTTISAGGMPATYGLGLMKKTFLGMTAYGHGGDLAYSASSWYFPSKDISITVLNNDAEITSWELIPTVTALLKTYNEWEAATSVSDFEAANTSVVAFPNPFSDKLSIAVQLDEPVTSIKLTLANALGQVITNVERTDVSSGETVLEFDDLNELNPGVYFVTVFAEGRNLKSIKVVK